jgi:hypothetical protein
VTPTNCNPSKSFIRRHSDRFRPWRLLLRTQLSCSNVSEGLDTLHHWASTEAPPASIAADKWEEIK